MSHFNSNSSSNLVFSQTTEDTELGVKALQLNKDSRVVIVSGSGDQVMAALPAEPHSILAVDISHEQLEFTQLKLLCAKYLSRDEYATILGLYEEESNPQKAAEKRRKLLEKLCSQITPEEAIFLKPIHQEIMNGIIDQGKAQLDRQKVQSVIRTLRKLFPEWIDIATGQNGGKEEREKLKLMRWLFKLLQKFSPLAPRILSPRIVQEATAQELKEVYAESMRKIEDLYKYGFANHPLTSHIAAQSLESCAESALPLQLKPEPYLAAQEMLRRGPKNGGTKIDYYSADIGKTSSWQGMHDNSFNGIYLSSVPVYISPEQRTDLYDECLRTLMPQGRIFVCSHDLNPPVQRPLSLSKGNFDSTGITWEKVNAAKTGGKGKGPRYYNWELVGTANKS